MYIRGDHIKKPIPHVVFEIVLDDWMKNKHCSMITNHILCIKHTYFQFKLLCLYMYLYVVICHSWQNQMELEYIKKYMNV